MGVVAGVHDAAAHLGAATQPALASGLAQAGVALFGVAHLTEGGVALATHQPHLGGGQLEGDVVPLLGHHLGAGTGRAHHLAAAAGVELHVVDAGAQRDRREGQGVAVLDRGIGPGDHRLTDGHVGGSQDVALLAVGVIQQRQAGVAVRVVVNRGHLGGHPVLVATEVDDAIEPFVAAAAVAAGDHAAVVAALVAVLGDHQPPFPVLARDLAEVGDHQRAGAGSVGPVVADCHDVSDPSGLREQLDGVALGKAHHRLLHLGTLAGEAPHPAGAARRIHGADADDLDVEQMLDGRLDVGLGGPMVHLEGVLVDLDGAGGLLGDQRAADDIRQPACETLRHRRRPPESSPVLLHSAPACWHGADRTR